MVLASLLLYLFPFLGAVFLYVKITSTKRVKNAPSPPHIPILGHVLDIANTEKLIGTLMKFVKLSGPNYVLNVGPFKQLFVTSDYKSIEHILSSQKLITKSEEYYFFQRWLGLGLLTSTGSRWRKHRKIISPAFHFKILEQFVEIYEKCGQKLVEKLKSKTQETSVNIYNFVTLATLDIICETAMGTSLDAQDHEHSEYVKSVKDMCRIMVERSTSPIHRLDFLYRFTSNYYQETRALEVLHGYTNSIIRERREQLRKSGHSDSPQENGGVELGVKVKKPFLDSLLESTVDGRPLTDLEIREEVDTFMFEGHDTTASGISFALYCLANHPSVQQRAFEEQNLLFQGEKNPEVSYADLQNMKYLELVIKETLRLYPSVPFFGRQCEEDLDLEGVWLPKGSTIIVLAFGIQRDPKLFENPDDFIPERFNEADGKMPYAFVPFSAGPRNCIGQKFAILEMKSTLSIIIRNFELSPAIPEHKVQLVSETILKSGNGININLKLR